MRIGSGLKRFFGSHIFRITVAAVILFSTVFFPLAFAYVDTPEDGRGVLIVIVVFTCLFELICFILVSHYFVFSKVRSAAKCLDEMAKNEIYGLKLKQRSIDGATDELTAAVNATSEEYERLEQMRKSFVANASHELRSPLTSVQGFCKQCSTARYRMRTKKNILKSR